MKYINCILTILFLSFAGEIEKRSEAIEKRFRKKRNSKKIETIYSSKYICESVHPMGQKSVILCVLNSVIAEIYRDVFSVMC